MKRKIALLCSILLLGLCITSTAYATINAAICDECGDGEVYLEYTDNRVELPATKKVGTHNGMPAMYFEFYYARDYHYRCGTCGHSFQLSGIRDTSPYHVELAYYL